MNSKLFAGIIGIVAFVLAFTLGSIVTFTTGVPLAGSLLNGVLVSMVLTIGMLASTYRWSATFMWLVFSILAIPTTTLGPPGFYKIPIALAAGFVWDLCYKTLFPNKERVGLYVGAIAGGIVITFLMIFILQLIVQGVGESLALSENIDDSLKKLKEFLWYLLPINIVVTVIGVKLGEFMYHSRLKSILDVHN